MWGLHGSVNLNMAFLFWFICCLWPVSVCLCVCEISSVDMSYSRESDTPLPSCRSLTVELSPMGEGWDSSWFLGTRALLDDLVQGPTFDVLSYVPYLAKERAGTGTQGSLSLLQWSICFSQGWLLGRGVQAQVVLQLTPVLALGLED